MDEDLENTKEKKKSKLWDEYGRKEQKWEGRYATKKGGEDIFHHGGSRKLWRKVTIHHFKEYGEVDKVVITPEKEKRGKMYDFTRFINIEN